MHQHAKWHIHRNHDSADTDHKMCLEVSTVTLTLMITENYGKFLNRWEYQTTLPVSWETYMQVKEQQLEPYMEHLTGSKSGKEYVKAVHCHLAYLTYKFRVHHVKCQTGWSTNWNKDCREKYQQPQICRWYHSNDKKWRGANEPLDVGERGEWKASLELNIQKTKIVANRRGKSRSNDRFSWSSKSLQVVTAATAEIQRCLLLERKTITTRQSIKKQRDHFVNKSPKSQSYDFSSSHVMDVKIGP